MNHTRRLLSVLVSRESLFITSQYRPISSGSYVPDGSLNFLDGKRVDCQDQYEKILVEEPATGKVICEMQGSGEQDVNNAVAAAKVAQKEWAAMSGYERGKIVIKCSELLTERREEMARVECYDTGKPIWEARYDIDTAIDALQYFGGLASSLHGEHINLSSGSFGFTRREPLGIVGAIGAWNYPIQMAGWKSAPALACGNAVVFKPSQFTPFTAVKLGEIFKEAGLPDGLYNVVQGGAHTGNLMTSHPDIAKVTFTGSVATGIKVMQNCANDIKQVTLELGGKSPLIIFDDCDIKNAVNGALMANFLSQGQVCSNGTRVFIQRGVYEKVVGLLVERATNLKLGDPHAEDTRMGAMINAQHAEKVMGYIDGARAEGAEILVGGNYRQMDGVLSGGKYVEPTIIAATDDMTISREEVFGPVMCVYPFDTEEEVIARANDTNFGLASGVFTKDLMRAHRIAASIEAGSCIINNFNIYPIELPFGGYKHSGLGRENGTTTINYYTQLKTVYVEANDVDCPL